MNRISKDTLSRLGSTPVVVYDGESAVLRFTNSAGNNTGTVNGNIDYSTPPGISPDTYSYLLGFFQSRSNSIENAKSKLQVHLDASLIYDIDPIELLQLYSADINNSLYLDLENIFRTAGAKKGYVTENTNLNSTVIRQIKA